MELEAYRDIAPTGTVELLYQLAEPLRGKRILHVSSTRYGGGVAQTLRSLNALLLDLGLDVAWEAMLGDGEFYATTKAFHHALSSGVDQGVTPSMLENYLHCNQENAKHLDLNADIVLIHDSQPLGLIEQKNDTSRWFWHCHMDLSKPSKKLWKFLEPLVHRFDGAIFTLPEFAQRLPIPHFLLEPAIDPLHERNHELTAKEIDGVLARLRIPKDKPLLLQVSRFDKARDPVGVIKAYRLVKQTHDCRLILAGGGATEDLEGKEILKEVRQEAGSDPNIHILDLPVDAHHEINALQRAATIILKKSLKDSFPSTVVEALWKGKPVVASAVGGIPTQVLWGVTGFTTSSIEGTAFRIRQLLDNPELQERLGRAGREFVRSRFLITRQLKDLLTLLRVYQNNN